MRSKPFRLMSPGPVPLPKEVLQALAQPMVHHRLPEFSEELKYVFSELKKAFATTQPVLLLTCTGSGVMEAAVTNTLSPGDEVLVMESGKFSRRWSQLARAYGLRVHVFRVDEGHPLPLQGMEDMLGQYPLIKAVMVQACETSTGTKNPVEDMSRWLRRGHPKVLFMVDAMGAMGAMELKVDEWGWDVVLASSQKAFMLPAGLGFISLSPRAWEANQVAQCPRFYFDLKLELEAHKKGHTRFSSPVSHIRALRWVLNRLNQLNHCGERVSWQRCKNLAQVTQWAVKEWGLELFSQSPSPSVTAIKVPHGVDGRGLQRRILQDCNIYVAGGQESLEGKILRIGHLGFIRDDDLVATLQGLGQSLRVMGWKLSERQVNEVVSKAQAQLQQLSLPNI